MAIARVIRKVKYHRSAGVKSNPTFNCPACGCKRLKLWDTVKRGSFNRPVYKCGNGKCQQLIEYDHAPASFYGDVEVKKTHVGNPLAGLTRMNKRIPRVFNKGKI